MELMKTVVGRWFSAFLVLVLVVAGGGAAQQREQGATRVFNRFAESVVEIHVMEKNSQAKVSGGSGFFVTDEGHIVTNYHVVSTHVLEPDDYDVRVILDDAPASAIVLAVDAVHDLALLEVPASGTTALQLRPQTVDQGDRLFSFGYPGDLGITIVEGTPENKVCPMCMMTEDISDTKYKARWDETSNDSSESGISSGSVIGFCGSGCLKHWEALGSRDGRFQTQEPRRRRRARKGRPRRGRQ